MIMQNAEMVFHMTNKDDNRIGLKFPLDFEDIGNAAEGEEPDRRLSPCTYAEHVRQSLQTLLLTARGERFMRPGYGSGLSAYLFENIDATTVSLIKSEVRSTVERYEPRIELIDVDVDHSARDPGALRVAVFYRIKSTGFSDQLTVDVSGKRRR